MKSLTSATEQGSHADGRPADAAVDEFAAVREDPADYEHVGLRRLIWVYFWLLLLEGAVRKWILPGLANPLLLVRDPVVVLIYLMALAGGVFPMNGFVVTTFGLGVASAAASLFVAPDHLFVTLYGLRANFLHIPLIFIMSEVFTRRDTERVGNYILASTIPMALLVLLQFRASPEAWINNGVGASVGGQLTVGFGKIRPPGTFSFTNGLTSYLSFASAFVLVWQIKKWKGDGRIAIAAVLAICIMIAVSGSRSALFSSAIIVGALIFACLRKPIFMGRGFKAAILIGLVFALLQSYHEVQQGMLIHEDRFTTGGGLKEGIVIRTLAEFTQPFAVISETPILGAGIGLGTSAAGGLLYGERSFLLAEGEWSRVLAESGPIIGLTYLAMRVLLVLLLLRRASHALTDENPIPIMIFSAVFLLILNGQFGVPTVLGFAVFGAGLCLSACKVGAVDEEPNAFRISPDSVNNPNRIVRGRSIYAEKLHGR